MTSLESEEKIEKEKNDVKIDNSGTSVEAGVESSINSADTNSALVSIEIKEDMVDNEMRIDNDNDSKADGKDIVTEMMLEEGEETLASKK